MEFVNVVKPSPRKHTYRDSLINPAGVIKDSFTMSTIILMGAAIQLALLQLIPLRIAAIPVLLVLGYRLLLTVLQTINLAHNPLMDGVVVGKTSTQFPNPENGRFGNTPASSAVTVIILGFQLNHPLGIFAPGLGPLREHVENMQEDLEKHGEEYGLLSSSTWRADQERGVQNQILFIMYFRTPEGMAKFAEAKAHREGWNWYNKAKLPFIGIMHEVFTMPKKAYESIYLNCYPNLMGASSMKVHNETNDGKDEWVRPLVAANKGVLRSHMGRLAKSAGKEHDEFGFDTEFHKTEYE